MQGVFFRFNIRKWAQELGLTGYAQNRSDGTVYVIAQGSKQNLDKLLEKCYSGSRYAKVKDVKPHWTKITANFSSFEIKL